MMHNVENQDDRQQFLNKLFLEGRLGFAGDGDGNWGFRGKKHSNMIQSLKSQTKLTS